MDGVQHPVEPDRAEHCAFTLCDKGCVGRVGRDPVEAPPHVLATELGYPKSVMRAARTPTSSFPAALILSSSIPSPRFV